MSSTEMAVAALAPRVQKSRGTLDNLMQLLDSGGSLPAALLETICNICDDCSVVEEVLQKIQTPSLCNFPHEVVGALLQYCDYDSVRKASCVSQSWAAVSRDEQVWAALYKRRDFLIPCTKPHLKWRERYTYRHECESRWLRPSKVQVISGQLGTVTSLQYDDCRLVTANDDGSIRVLDSETGKQLTPGINGHAGPVWAVRFQGEHHVLSGSYDKTIKLWDLFTGNCVATMRGHTGWVSCLEVDRNCPEFISASWDETVRVWRMRDQGDVDVGADCRAILAGEAGSVFCALRVGANLATGCQNSEITWWDLERAEVSARWNGHEKMVYAIQSSQGVIASGDAEGVVKLWDARTRTATSTTVAHSLSVMTMSLQHNKLLTGSNDKSIALWDIRCMKERVATYSHHKGAVFCLQADDSKIVSGSADQTLCIWDFREVDARRDDWRGIITDRRFELLQSLSKLS